MPAPFKAYDIRGRVPDELDAALAFGIGHAFAGVTGARQTIVGRDIRTSSAALADALAQGLMVGGSDVVDIGLCGSEEVYFATSRLEADGGIMITASHNPIDYNGMKLVRRGARPISGDSGLRDIEMLARTRRFEVPQTQGTYSRRDMRDDYIRHLLGYVDIASLKPLKIVANAGNGCAGPVIERLAAHLPFDIIGVYAEPDGSFPHGIPNPLLPENRAATADAVRRHGADLGLAWDGDFDRCFFFDERGAFIEGYYLVGLLAQMQLARHKGGKIVHDPRLTWNTIETVRDAGGTPVQCKTGHAFIKERMRAEDAVYGGEMSAHHYFRDFSYCDSGMIPWLLVAGLMSRTGKPLSALVGDRAARFPCSGEINFVVADPAAAMETVLGAFAADDPVIDQTDGISAEFADWRFNLRSSNTESVLRLNVETRCDPDALARHTRQLKALIEGASI